MIEAAKCLLEKEDAGGLEKLRVEKQKTPGSMILEWWTSMNAVLNICLYILLKYDFGEVMTDVSQVRPMKD